VGWGAGRTQGGPLGEMKSCLLWASAAATTRCNSCRQIFASTPRETAGFPIFHGTCHFWCLLPQRQFAFLSPSPIPMPVLPSENTVLLPSMFTLFPSSTPPFPPVLFTFDFPDPDDGPLLRSCPRKARHCCRHRSILRPDPGLLSSSPKPAPAPSIPAGSRRFLGHPAAWNCTRICTNRAGPSLVLLTLLLPVSLAPALCPWPAAPPT